MKKIKNIACTMVLSLGGLAVHAQQAPMYTHYMYNTLTVNPAYAGSRDALTLTALHRSQWVSFKGAPMTQTVTLHGPIRNRNIGLGLALSNDKIGPINNTGVILDFSYSIRLNTKSKLALGVSGGANIMQANLNTLNLDQQNDPVFAENVRNRFTPNFGFGAYYSRERFYAGISAPNLIENSISRTNMPDGSTLLGKAKRHYFFIAGALFNLSENLAFKPTTLIKVTEAAPIQLDVTASFIIMKRFLLGAMYRTGDALGVLVGFDITDQFHLGYSFDWSYGLRTAKYNNGSHEILLRYDFNFHGKKQIHSPRHF